MLMALPPVVALAVPPLPAPEVADRLWVLLSELFESFWVTRPPLFAAFWPPLTVVVFVLFEFFVLPESRLLPLAWTAVDPLLAAAPPALAELVLVLSEPRCSVLPLA